MASRATPGRRLTIARHLPGPVRALLERAQVEAPRELAELPLVAFACALCLLALAGAWVVS